MGTKSVLSTKIAALVSSCGEGPFLDVFAGMCSVGRSVGKGRQVWSNDLQKFSCVVAKSLFTSNSVPPLSSDLANLLGAAIAGKKHSIGGRYRAAMSREHAAMELGSAASQTAGLIDLFEDRFQETAGQQRLDDIFVRNFGALYFGYEQSIEIDAIRATLDEAHAEGRISEDTVRWTILALAISMNKCTSSTGHFAQPLRPKESTVKRIIRQRRRSIMGETLNALNELRPIGTTKWRKGNRSFNGDAVTLLNDLRSHRVRPAVIYADPPYTEDQYSRYYHIYETLVEYKEPGCSGRGRYRDRRATSDFSLSSKSEAALNKLIFNSASLDCALILSYPENGLIKNSSKIIPEMIKSNYSKYPEIISTTIEHSTMGASKGHAKKQATEHIYKVAV